MKFIKAITIGSGRAIRSYKAVLIIWLTSILLTSLITGPFKSSLISAVGNSFGTEMISDGFSIDFWTGLNPVFQSSMSGFITGLVSLLLFYIFIGVFLNGGLFDSLRSNTCSYTLKEFFRASASNFLSFFVVTLMVLLMLIFTAGLIIGVPVLIVQNGSGGEDTLFKVLNISRIAFLIVLPILLLVADYARVWLSASENKHGFKALGYGFKATFGSFIPSYLFMVLILAIQLGFVYLASKVLNFYGSLFLIFVLGQLLLLLKLFLRAWRYGGISTMHII